MQLIIECLHQREVNDTARRAGAQHSTSAAAAGHNAVSLRQLRHERLGAALFGAVRSESVSRENAVVYGVPSAPAVGRVIGFYNRTTMVFELDDRYDVDDELDGFGTGGGGDDVAVAVGVPIGGLQQQIAPLAPATATTSVAAVAEVAGEDVIMTPPAVEDADDLYTGTTTTTTTNHHESSSNVNDHAHGGHNDSSSVSHLHHDSV